MAQAPATVAFVRVRAPLNPTDKVAQLLSLARHLTAIELYRLLDGVSKMIVMGRKDEVALAGFPAPDPH